MAETNDTCSFEDCGRERRARLLCEGHYKQLSRGRELTPLPKRLRRGSSAADRLVHYSRTDPLTGCREWQNARNLGYGQLWHQGKMSSAHRVAWELSKGSVPSGMILDHKCRNRACINLDHLHMVTKKQNAENLSPERESSSGIRGVSRCKQTGRWAVQVTHNQKKYWVGRFSSLKDAESAAIAKRNELFTNNIADRTGGGNRGRALEQDAA